MPVDYHKWDHIEVSDDEDDTHPNVDTASLFRWRHQARLDRMAETKREKEQFQETISSHQRKVAEIKQKLAAAALEDQDKERLKLELSELEKQEQEFRKKEEELAKKERLQPLNVDTIGYEGFSKSRVNKIEPPKSSEDVDDEARAEKMQSFVAKNDSLLKKFGMLKKWDDSKQFLLDNPHLCCEETANHLVLQCLEYEMEEKHELMGHVAHQTVIIQYLLELATQLKVNPKAPQLISSFFSKLKQADKMYHEAFEDELKQFKERIQRRAKEKVEELMREAEEEERKQRLGPGGLDPVEVFETLPKEMQECFEKQEIAALQNVAMKMDPAEFQHHLKRCIDSGLWVPDANKDKENENTISNDNNNNNNQEESGASAAAAGDLLKSENGVEVNISADSSATKEKAGGDNETEMRHRKAANN